ncbi:MAG: hypothetical protein NC344_10270 [Bacteroidales bacterium]|nr:hypothetical protein [Bacteroidales bacterium]MCM1148189.1 hypothetical protein [Bacteroidales bacterium]MCM1207084.1 hypothetical protein [Bacillota bacterium]MCM1510828.1 hypothetical protein [Clostridium sp.]
MIRARLYIPRYDWVIYAYIAVHEYYTDEILGKMRQIGADAHSVSRAYSNLTSRRLNNGLTYSSPAGRETVWVTEITSSAGEFFNSIVHEIRHLQQHIANEFGIDQNSEEACYLCGDIAFMLFPYVQGLLCDHCRNEH